MKNEVFCNHPVRLISDHPVRLISDSPKYTFTYEVQHNWFLPKVNVHNFNNHYCIRIINIITEDAGYTHYWFVLWYNMGNTEFSTFLNSTELFFHKKIFMMYLRNLVSNKFFFFQEVEHWVSYAVAFAKWAHFSARHSSEGHVITPKWVLVALKLIIYYVKKITCY